MPAQEVSHRSLDLDDLVSRGDRAGRELSAARSTLQESIRRLHETYRRIEDYHHPEGLHNGSGPVAQLKQLTPREVEVLRLIAKGLSTKEVAGRLGIAFKTAVSHRTHLLQKLNKHETASIVRFAIRAGLVSA